MARTPRPGSVRYQPDIRGTYDTVIQSTGMKAMLRSVAEEGVAVAKGLAEPFAQSHDYQNALHVEEGAYTGRSGDDRPEARVATGVDYDLAVEKRHHVLGKTANALDAKYGRRGGKKRH